MIVMPDRLVFGRDDAPVDPQRCVARVRRQEDGVLVQELCLHTRSDHRGKGAGCTAMLDDELGVSCRCTGFVTSARLP